MVKKKSGIQKETSGGSPADIVGDSQAVADQETTPSMDLGKPRPGESEEEYLRRCLRERLRLKRDSRFLDE